MQDRIGITVHASGVKQRQHNQLHRVAVDASGQAKIHRVIKIHAKGNHRALWMTGRSRGVHDHGHIVVITKRRLIVC